MDMDIILIIAISISFAATNKLLKMYGKKSMRKPMGFRWNILRKLNCHKKALQRSNCFCNYFFFTRYFNVIMHIRM